MIDTSSIQLSELFLISTDPVDFLSGICEKIPECSFSVYDTEEHLLWSIGAPQPGTGTVAMPLTVQGRQVSSLQTNAGLPRKTLELICRYLEKFSVFSTGLPDRQQIITDALTELLVSRDATRLHSIRVRIGLNTFARNGHYLNCRLISIHLSGDRKALLQSLRSEFPQMIICPFRELILMFFTTERNDILEPDLEIQIRNAIINAHALACCSDSFFEPFHDFRLQQHLERNEDAVYYAMRSGITEGLIFYDSYKFPAMVSAALDAAPNMDNMQFVSVKIRQIMEYDEANKTEFLHTLYMYLLLNMSYSHTAEALFVHRNTIVYRIEQLSERFQIRFEDPDERFILLLSCKILQTLDRKPVDASTLNASPALPVKEHPTVPVLRRRVSISKCSNQMTQE